MAADGHYQQHDWGNMEGEEMIALRWNNHLSTLSQLLYSLREEETLIDATLACEGRLFPAHKFVLSMCSDYFKEMFSSNPCKHPIVFLKDVRYEDMEALLDFMYRGVVHIPQEALNSLLKTAEGLQIRGLGLFAKETGEGNLGHTPDSRIMEPNVLMSPDRKRPYVMDHSDGFTFTDGEVDTEGTLQTPVKRKYEKYDGPPAPVPELPRVNDDTLDMGGGIHISAEDYFKLRRNNPNRYINDLLRYFFPMEVLINSSLTGTECFANKNKDRVNPVIKNQLDPNIIKVITIDSIRNFPVIDEKQVRNAIRRKLQTETRIYRSQEKMGIPGARRNGGPKRKQPAMGDSSPLAMVSIEKSERKKEEQIQSMDTSHNSTSELRMEKTEDAHQDSLQDVNENVHENIHENLHSSSYPSPIQSLTEKSANTVQQEQQQSQQQQQQRSSSTTPTPQHSTPVHHSSIPTSASSPVASSHSSLDLKTFKPHENIVKSELPSSAQYLPQEYSYPSMMAPHVSQAYLPHHMAATDPSYLRRLEMTQGAPLAHPYSYLPTSEPSLHM